jgi:hypothetical protein
MYLDDWLDEPHDLAPAHLTEAQIERERVRRKKAAEIRAKADARHESMCRVPLDYFCDMLEEYVTSRESCDMGDYDAIEIIEHIRRRFGDVTATITIKE